MEKPIVAGKDITAELPLSLYEAMSIGGMSLPDGEALSIQIGLSKDMVEKLKQHARNEEDTELQANTSDYRRFVENSYEAWYMKDRTPFALVSATGELAAIIWFGPENPPHKEKGLWDTVAFRSYPPYRGKGIMTPFGKFALTTYTMLRPDRSI
ncbi:hypothetical protein KKG57_01735, partial [Patescibacteria group bacterium]|nr:hypothetical protein [Patescibacteria group bacterium]